LQRYQYDLAAHMGDLLRQTSKVKFDSLSSIRSAYSQAFSDSYEDIDAALCSDDLDRISTMRNVLIHRSGMADAEYCRRALGLGLPVAADGERVPIDGDLVVGLLRSTTQCGINLVAAVDAWLAAH